MEASMEYASAITPSIRQYLLYNDACNQLYIGKNISILSLISFFIG